MTGSSEYWKQLQSLNIGVSQWISSHVEKNPHVDLTPIFRDYEKHLKTIDMKVCVCVYTYLVHVYMQGHAHFPEAGIMCSALKELVPINNSSCRNYM